MSDISKLLAGMKKNYKNAVATAKKFSGEKLPEGKYECRVHPVKLYNKKGDDKISLQVTYTVLSGEHEGMSHTEFNNLMNENGLAHAMMFVTALGYDVPDEDNPDGWVELVEAMNENPLTVVVDCTHYKDFVNMKVLEVLEDEDDGLDEMSRAELKAKLKELDPSYKVTTSKTDDDLRDAIRDLIGVEDEESEEEEEPEEEEESEEDELDEFDDMSRAELKKFIKDNELDIKVTTSKTDDDLRKAIRNEL